MMALDQSIGSLKSGASDAGQANRELIIALTARYGVPAIYYNRFFSELGALILW
jgi:hypothetical protein